MLATQVAQVIPDGPAWIVALSVALPAVAGAVKLGASIVRGKPENGAAHDTVPAVEFRVDVRSRLDRLTQIAAEQSETSRHVARILERLDATLETHDRRGAEAAKLMSETARQVAQMHKMIVSDP